MRLQLFFIILIISVLCCDTTSAQAPYGTIAGEVVSDGKPVPFANIGIKGTLWGATTDEKGRFEINSVPAGQYELQVSYIGFEKQVVRVLVTGPEKDTRIQVMLKPLLKALDEVVVTGTRSEKRRLDSAVPVNILDSRTMQATQSLTLSEGLSFQPGIRVEKDCQTCNYSQVRMNGLAGSYSQILINSKPLLSSLAGLYGLEQIPASMIERVEIVKGGGSVLYGSSAIGGTINVITRDPSENKAELESTGSLVNGESADIQTDLYTSLVNRKKTAGTSLVLSQRDREPWDANADGFSELAEIENLSLGLNSFMKIAPGAKLHIGLNRIHEIRNGGDRLEEEPHMRLQSEFRDSEILAANVDFTKQFYGARASLQIHSGIQQTTRDHYTGSFGADGYGSTLNKTYIGGIQINHTLLTFLHGKNILAIGFEYQYDYVNDEIAAYNYFINQETFQPGVYLQSDWEITPKFSFISGVRWSKHNKAERDFINPRFNILYKATSNLQFRAARSEGFRAPQAFDTDMHIAFAGGGVALTVIDPGLQSEKSVSYSFSGDYNKPAHNYIYGLTVSGFYTRLQNTFILEQLPGTAPGGNMILLRTNGSAAEVQGITFEARANYNYKIEGDLGITIQKSAYEKPVAWSDELEGTIRFLRTPSAYGYFTLTYSGLRKFKVACSGVYTGTMEVPHYGGANGDQRDEVVSTKSFMELNIKSSYEVISTLKPVGVVITAGIQNLFNEFQNDFDSGPGRDSNYMYGPGRPLTLYGGIRLTFNYLKSSLVGG